MVALAEPAGYGPRKWTRARSATAWPAAGGRARSARPVAVTKPRGRAMEMRMRRRENMKKQKRRKNTRSMKSKGKRWKELRKKVAIR